MRPYIVFGDISPTSVVYLSEEEIKIMSTQLMLGVAPEDIKISGKVFDGSRTLGVVAGFNVVGKGDYIVVSQGINLVLERDEGMAGVIPF